MNRYLPISILINIFAVSNALAVDIDPNQQLSLYGVIGADVYLADDGDDASIGVSSNNSFIGFKGRYPIEQDYHLRWQIEQGVNIDQGGDNFASRNTFLAVGRGGVDVLIGKYDTPFKQIIEPISYFNGTFADIRSVMGNSALGPATNSFNLRADNTIQVSWRADEKLQVIGFYSGQTNSAGTNALDDNDAGDLSALAVHYRQGPLLVSGAWQAQEIGDGSGLRLVGQYDMGDILLGGAFETISADNLNTPDRSAIALNAKFHWKPTTDLVGQLVLVNDDEIDNTGATHLSAGAYHRIDARLELYGVLSLLHNQSSARYSMGFERTDLAVPSKLGEDPVGIAVGAIFSF